MKRGEIHWANLGPPAGRRPVLILTRDPVIPVLTRVVVAPVTRTIRGIKSEVPVGPREGLPMASVVSCDNLLTVAKTLLDPSPVGALSPEKVRRLDAALRHALGIRH